MWGFGDEAAAAVGTQKYEKLAKQGYGKPIEPAQEMPHGLHWHRPQCVLDARQGKLAF